MTVKNRFNNSIIYGFFLFLIDYDELAAFKVITLISSPIYSLKLPQWRLTSLDNIIFV